MADKIRRIYVEKPDGFDIEAKKIKNELYREYRINGLKTLRILHRYDIQGLSDDEYIKARKQVFSEPNVDMTYDEHLPDFEGKVFVVQYLPGQFDQRADSARQCLSLITGRDGAQVAYAKVVIVNDDLSASEFDKVKQYYINPVESREASLLKPDTLLTEYPVPETVKTIHGFISLDNDKLLALKDELGLAMSGGDIIFCQEYFKNSEKRDPTITELRVIDTYWSDHCRHTTFLTNITDVKFDEGRISGHISRAYTDYLDKRTLIYEDREAKPVCLMDIATAAMKYLKKTGQLEDLDLSEEINACSINVDVRTDAGCEKWLLMFKNETHNHPTEIEPFGGAATCLGGAIRDPLSGRAYVYHAMRVTGSGDPNTPVEETIPGKLPQRTITKGAAHGYSSYGNQIGLATGLVDEIYDEGYVAKRMEIGAVIGAAPADYVIRKKPVKGDAVILLGGRTGRDGCGGATGSSKEHDEDSLAECGAEVQKGNPPTERKIQRLFRKPAVTRMIKRCNDFGAGGVSVAIGELASGLDIFLDMVPKKYEGLDGTELAISESQERMAVVVDTIDVERFINEAAVENLEATVVAEVTDSMRMRMWHKESLIVDLTREFLDSNGAVQYAKVHVTEPDIMTWQDGYPSRSDKMTKSLAIEIAGGLDICSRKGLCEQFDSTIGAGTVLMPFGGKYQLTPEQGMCALFPVLSEDAHTASLMTYGYYPKIARQSPYHSALYAVVDSVSKIVAMGADYFGVRLTLQEYFEKLYDDPKRWAKPFAALLGAYRASLELGIAAIGGKDSMSGTFKDMDVPPTLVSFAVAALEAATVISSEFKKSGSYVYILRTTFVDDGMIDFEKLKQNYIFINSLIRSKKVSTVRAVTKGGIFEAVMKMCFGNMLGIKMKDMSVKSLTAPLFGSFIIETDDLIDGLEEIGRLADEPDIVIGDEKIGLDVLLNSYDSTLENVFLTKTKADTKKIQTLTDSKVYTFITKKPDAAPVAFIPVFPGTNCEYDSQRRFEKAGIKVKTAVFRNLDPFMIKDSVAEFEEMIKSSNIIMIPGGFSAGDEPEGSGKFIATVFRNERIKEAVEILLDKRDGLILGICNGFQALIKLGLLPYGRITELDPGSPTLTFNSIGRHISRLVRTRITVTASPWLSNVKAGDVFTVPVSHGEGRFYANDRTLAGLISESQIATQYVDMHDEATMEMPFNPNGSVCAIEGILSPDGRIFGKMGHSERIGKNLYINVPGEYDMKLFESGAAYYKI